MMGGPKESIGIKSVTIEGATYWAVTVDFRRLGDSKLYDCRQSAIAEAQSLVRADPDYRQMEIV